MGCLSFWKVFTSKSEKYDISTRIRKKPLLKKHCQVEKTKIDAHFENNAERKKKLKLHLKTCIVR